MAPLARFIMARNNSRRSAPSGPLKIAILFACLLLFGAGLYLGIQVAKPPARPELGRAVEGSAPPRPEVGQEPRPGGGGAPVVRPLDAGPGPVASAPRVAIVIDDLGRSLADLDTLGALGIPLTYAVLPFESQTAAVVSELERRGVEVLCHLPMEAKGDANPGPGALTLAMSEGELVAATERALAAVPAAVGVNNHMGSAIASNRKAISTVLGVVARHRLYFLDSRTSVDTLGFTIARQLGLRAGERRVFLDTEKDEAFIEGQFDRLLDEARQHGTAIAIAHPYAETLSVLARRVGEARRAGIEFVVASQLLEG